VLQVIASIPLKVSASTVIMKFVLDMQTLLQRFVLMTLQSAREMGRNRTPQHQHQHQHHLQFQLQAASFWMQRKLVLVIAMALRSILATITIGRKKRVTATFIVNNSAIVAMTSSLFAVQSMAAQTNMLLFQRK
jgi:hypothetical protein